MREITKRVHNIHNPTHEVVDGNEAGESTASFSFGFYRDIPLLNLRSRTACVIKTFSLLGLILSGLFSHVFRLG